MAGEQSDTLGLLRLNDRKSVCHQLWHISQELIGLVDDSEAYARCARTLSASHQLVLVRSLPFVHTARRSYRLSDPVNNSDCSSVQLLNVAAESLMNLIT